MKNVHILQTDKPSRLWINNLRRRLELDEFPSQHPTNIAKHIYITNDEEIKEGDWFYNTISLKPEPLKACENGDGYVNCSKYSHYRIDCKKIILTTDQDLIKDGVQSIDNEFLEWFVKNPSCESVEVIQLCKIGCEKLILNGINSICCGDKEYKIIISKEEPKQEQEVCNHCGKTLREQMKGCGEITCYRQFLSKQETLEEAAEKYIAEDNNNRYYNDFMEGAKWQQERMYSEEDMRLAIKKARDISDGKDCFDAEDISGCTEVSTYGWKFNMSEDSIIEQFKKK